MSEEKTLYRSKTKVMSTDPPPLGKFNEESLNKYVFPYLDQSGRRRTRLRFGSDFNVVDLDEGNALAISTDPLAISPQMGWRRSGELAVHVITADVAVSGLYPSWLLVDWNLPPNLSNDTFEKIWQGFTGEANEVGVTIAGGHTGRYQNQEFPIVGAGTAFGIGPRNRVLSGDFSPGDRIYLLNKLGLEAAAIFAFYHPRVLAGEIPSKALTRVKRNFDQLKPTQELGALASLPGLRSLHDVAEGGFLGGVQEVLADQSEGAIIHSNRIEISPDVAQICDYLELDPLSVTSIGSGIAIVSQDREDEFVKAAKGGQVDPAFVGEITATGGITVVANGEEEVLTEPVVDKFWSRLSQFEEEYR